MSMVARYYTSVACLDKQAEEVVVLVTCGPSSTRRWLLTYTPLQKSRSEWQIGNEK